MSKIDRSYHDQTIMAEALMGEEESIFAKLKKMLHLKKEEDLMYEAEGDPEMIELEEELVAVGGVQTLRMSRKRAEV